VVRGFEERAIRGMMTPPHGFGVNLSNPGLYSRNWTFFPVSEVRSHNIVKCV
jgi:hypothetical protein